MWVDIAGVASSILAAPTTYSGTSVPAAATLISQGSLSRCTSAGEHGGNQKDTDGAQRDTEVPSFRAISYVDIAGVTGSIQSRPP